MTNVSIYSRKTWLLAGVALLGGALSTNAHAQSVAPETDTADSETGIRDIIVTAQRRSENIQTVPIAVSAMSPDELSATGVSGTQDLTLAVPGLLYFEQIGMGTPFIRGVGTSNNNVGNENPVSTYIDGVYTPASSTADFDFNNIERVEVLRGPQGTLFGRNSSGGVIQVITRTPSLTTPSAEGTFGYGNYDTLHANAYVSTPLSGSAAIDIAANYRNQRDGYGQNIPTGGDVQGGKSSAIRGKLYWEPGESTKITLSASYSYMKANHGLGYNTVPPALPGGFNDIASTIAPYSRRESSLVALTVERQLGSVVLKSITSYQDADFVLSVDVDGVPLNLLIGSVDASERFFTQELQLSSQSAGPLTWTAGIFYYNGSSGQHRLTSGGAPTVVPLGILNIGRQYTDSYAGYAQATYKVAESTRITAGIRYTADDRKLVSTIRSPTGVVSGQPVGFDPTDSVSKMTWRLAVDHQIDPDVMVYASYNRGFKSGVYDTGTLAPPATKPEMIDAYEAGLKSTLLDRKVRLNLAAYYYDYSNLQVLNVGVNGGNVLQNASSARVYGIEGELKVAPTRDLVIRSNIAWQPKAEYRNYKNAVVGSLPPFDASGNRMTRTPKLTASIGADYTIRTDHGDFTITGNYYHTSSFFQDVGNILKQNAYGLVSANLKWTSPDDRFSVNFWGKNLANKRYYSNMIYIVRPLTIAAAPRTYGADVSFKF